MKTFAQENLTMSRREFIKSAVLGVACLSPFCVGSLFADSPFPVNGKTTLLNIMLEGGPDLRHLFVPPYNSNASSYGNIYWLSRALSHSISSTPDAFNARYTNDYIEVTATNGAKFGILKKAKWLADMYAAGKVAIVCNMVGSKSRDHSHSQLVLNSGDLTTGPHDFDRNGWGGRLAKTLLANVISLTPQVGLFCNGPSSTNPVSHDNSIVVSVKDSRTIGLYSYDMNASNNDWRYNGQAIMNRALSSYYAALRAEMDATSPYYKFVRHEKSMREFGSALTGRLKSIPVPSSMSALYDSKSANKLNDTGFGKQIANFYDSLAASDLLNMRVASARYGGWDSHKKQVETIEPKLQDIFGDGKALSSLYTQLATDMPDAKSNLIVTVAGEFGRQLAANGDNGTDHGTGNYMLVIGDKVKGGVYGTMYPDSEIPRYKQPNSDTAGLTSIERLLGAVCDKMGTGAGDAVFASRATSAIESGVDFSGLFRA